jgi:hypothetical protein
MSGSAVLLVARLRGLGHEADCDLLARKQSPHLGRGYIWASIVNAPSDLPDGEYQVVFDRHVLQVTKERGQWLSSGAIMRESH